MWRRGRFQHAHARFLRRLALAAAWLLLAVAARVDAASYDGVGWRGESLACTECHPDERIASHPIGMVPSMAVPADLPLDEKGRVSCFTCHRDHGDIQPTGDGLRSLRRATVRALCQSCHSFEPVMNHRGNLPFAHTFDHRSRIVDSRGVDRRSLDCLGCHDGIHPMIGGEGVRRASLGWSLGGVGTSHPIGVELVQRSDRSGRKLSWQPAGDPRVRLLGGRVGCPSCHNPFSPAPNKLVMDNRGSHLCFACHAM